jgi:hypothetical protein
MAISLAAGVAAWCDADMSANRTAHMRLIHRWLRGEVVQGAVGIRVRGGPFDGKIRIMRLDAEGVPPARTRAWKEGAWQVYVLEPDAEENSSWIYRYDGAQPGEPPWRGA